MLSSRSFALRFLSRSRFEKCLNDHAALKDGGGIFEAKSTALPFSSIPRPKGFPLVGNMADYGPKNGGTEKLVFTHQRYFKRLGPIFLESIFGRTMLHVMDPEDFQTVYRCEGKHPNRPFVDPWVAYRDEKRYHRGLPQSCGSEWERVRQALSPKMMHPNKVREYVDGFNNVADDVMRELHASRGTSTDVNELPELEKLMFRWSTESIATVVFAWRIGLFHNSPQRDPNDFIDAVHDFFLYTHKLLFSFPWYKLVRTPSWQKFCKAQDTALDIGQRYVDRKLKEIEEKGKAPEEIINEKAVNMLTYLLTKKELTPHEVNINAIEMFMAGVDTTSSTMLWLLYNIACNSEVQDKLYQEVISLIGENGNLKEEDLARIPYMKACLKESLRLFPVVPFNARLLEEDRILSGYHVPKGTFVLMSTFSAGHSEQFFTEPEMYRPERWLRETKDNFHSFAVLPFGFGARMCLGRRVAETEMFVLLAKIIQRYKIVYDKEPVEPIMKVLLVPDRPLRIQFIDRTQSADHK